MAEAIAKLNSVDESLLIVGIVRVNIALFEVHLQLNGCQKKFIALLIINLSICLRRLTESTTAH